MRRDWAKKTLRGTINRINAKQPGNKLKVVSMNNLRHSFASQHLNAGTPLLKVSAMMSHSRPTTMVAIYSKWAASEESNAETVLAARIFTADEHDDIKTA